VRFYNEARIKYLVESIYVISVIYRYRAFSKTLYMTSYLRFNAKGIWSTIRRIDPDEIISMS